MLKNKVSIYVPSTYRDQAAPENVVNYYVNDTLRKLSVMFGGATATTATGSYYSPELDKLITEQITICCAYCSEFDRAALVAICEKLKVVFMQEAISLETPAGLEFV